MRERAPATLKKKRPHAPDEKETLEDTKKGKVSSATRILHLRLRPLPPSSNIGFLKGCSWENFRPGAARAAFHQKRRRLQDEPIVVLPSAVSFSLFPLELLQPLLSSLILICLSSSSTSPFSISILKLSSSSSSNDLALFFSYTSIFPFSQAREPL